MKLSLQTLILLVSVNLSAVPALRIDDLVYKPIEFTVVDEAGIPVEDARITASDPGPGNLTGTTNTDGKLRLRLAAQISLTIEVNHPEFYTTRGRIWQSGMEKISTGSYQPREMPENFDVILKRIRDPMEMVYRMYRGHAPRSDKPVGFDLLLGDWIAPHGAGKTPDLLFRFHEINIQKNAFKGSMTLTFPNEGDGIRSFIAPRPHSQQYGSALAPPHKAPNDGYRPSLSYSLSQVQGQPRVDYKKPDRHYIFRSRTITDSEGRIRKACYGWILGEIEFDPRDPKGPQLAFTYHFNPDPSPNQRSLESTMYLP
ncbi:MAG: hypothetical protein AB3N63_13360 [Puniceicoccaceae bacterium]